MNNRIKKVAYISAILFFGFICLYVYVWIFNPNPNLDWKYISLGKDFHFAVTKNWGRQLRPFNQDGPYTGSIISFAGDKTVSKVGWDGPGIYFRSIKHSVRKEWDQWTLMISLWYPIILFGILPVIFLIKNCAIANQLESQPFKKHVQ